VVWDEQLKQEFEQALGEHRANYEQHRLLQGNAFLGIETNEEAEVWIDKRKVGITTGRYLAVENLLAGTHVVEARTQYAYGQAQVTLEPKDAQRVKIELQPLRGDIRVLCKVGDVEVEIEGKRYRPPVVIRGLSAGWKEVTVSRGETKFLTDVEVLPGKVVDLTVTENTLTLSLQSAAAGPVLKLGDFVATEPRDILVANRGIQERVARDLADPSSKVSLWLQGFPHLKESIDRYRSLRRFELDYLCYALQGGFLLKGRVIRDGKELKGGLRDHPEVLQPDDVPRLNEWLKNYLDTSLNQILLDLAAEPNLAPEGFLHLSTCALRNDSDKDLHVFAVMDRLVALVSKEWENMSERVKGQLVREMTDALARARQSLDPVVYLEKFRDLLKKHQTGNRALLESLLSSLEQNFFLPLAQRIPCGNKEGGTTLLGFSSSGDESVGFAIEVLRKSGWVEACEVTAPGVSWSMRTRPNEAVMRFASLYTEVGDLVRALAPASTLTKRREAEQQVLQVVFREISLRNNAEKAEKEKVVQKAVPTNMLEILLYHLDNFWRQREEIERAVAIFAASRLATPTPEVVKRELERMIWKR
jgi:hypothetical protein